MTNNPFLSKTFTSIWLKYFQRDKPVHKFDSIENVSFTKNKYLPLYTNLGQNITNGMFYSIKTGENIVDYKHKVFLIHDVPSYFNIDSVNKNGSRLKLKSVSQYKGFLSDLSEYKSVEDYKGKEFTSKNRYSVNRKRKRLEACFNISFKVFSGHISKEDYQYLFPKFKDLIASRFGELKKENNIVNSWDYYYELAYEMINNNHAAFAVVYNDEEPISMSFNFLSEDVMFFAVTSYSTLFNKFSLGHSSIEYLIDWCCKNGIKTFDMSKGVYLYKTRWSNKEYIFDIHILYDSKSILASIIAKSIKAKYAFKQYLRDKNVNGQYVKLKFLLRGKKSTVSYKREFSIVKPEVVEDTRQMQLINLDTQEFSFLKSIVYDELYKNPEVYSGLKVFSINGLDKSVYYVVGEKNNFKIIVD